MATGWIKSFQCKSKASDDVVNTHRHHRRRRHLSNSSSCRSSVQNLIDIVETSTEVPPREQKPPKPPNTPPFFRPGSGPTHPDRTRSGNTRSFVPSLTELPQGHPSRNVVEIIFHTSWGEKTFSGRIEIVFKVQNLNRTLTRFEEYREMVRSRVGTFGAGEDHARCVADGNEVMRFYCLGAAAGDGAFEAGCGAWAPHGGKGGGAALCTYSGSGCAHEKAGGGSGRRAMLVCRVIAGRVGKDAGFDPFVVGGGGYDSVSKESGELVVFDTRALLPCFLIIYNKL